jgi:hypothetical protein
MYTGRGTSSFFSNSSQQQFTIVKNFDTLQLRSIKSTLLTSDLESEIQVAPLVQPWTARQAVASFQSFSKSTRSQGPYF